MPPRRRARPALHWQYVVLEGLLRLVPALSAMVLLLVLRMAVAAAGLATNALDLALQLAIVLIVVRAGVYLVGLLLGPRSWLHNWEPQVTLSLWLVIAFHLVGWFSDIETRARRHRPAARQDPFHALVAAQEPGGGHRPSCWSCSLISRAIERRVMKLSQRRALDAHRHHQVQPISSWSASACCSASTRPAST